MNQLPTQQKRAVKSRSLISVPQHPGLENLSGRCAKLSNSFREHQPRLLRREDNQRFLSRCRGFFAALIRFGPVPMRGERSSAMIHLRPRVPLYYITRDTATPRNDEDHTIVRTNRLRRAFHRLDVPAKSVAEKNASAAF